MCAVVFRLEKQIDIISSDTRESSRYPAAWHSRKGQMPPTNAMQRNFLQIDTKG
jgi:hypothetical protein